MAAMAETAHLVVQLGLKDNLSGGLKRATGGLGNFSANTRQVAKGLGQLAGGFARLGAIAGTLAVGGIVAAAKAGIDFEDAFAGVRKTINQTELAAAGLSFEALAGQFRKMATEMPISAVAFARIGETAGALGIKAADITEFTRVVALMGVTTNLTTDAAAEGMGKLGTILGLTGDDYAELADAIVNLGNNGASTEAEIVELSKRFAASGRQAGLAKEDIVALASAAASLGIEPEAGGSALSRIFANMTSNIANATDKGKAFGKIAGRSINDMVAAIGRGDSLQLYLDFLKGLSGLDRVQASQSLKAAGIVNVRDRDAILKMAQNLGFVNEQLDIARNGTGALESEAGKRFDTLSSKLMVLKNTVVEAGITISEGMLPAIGRAVDKLRAFLTLPETKGDLRNLGKEIGDGIDKINWEAVIGGVKTFAGFMKQALNIIRLIPPEIAAVAGGALGLNKLSGGLLAKGLGNVIAGAVGGLLSRGGSRATPMYVQEVGIGGPGGGGKGGPGGIANTVAGIIGVVSLAAIANEIHEPLQDIAKDISKAIGTDKGPLADFGRSVGDLEWPFGPRNTPRLDIGPFTDILGGRHQSVDALEAGQQTQAFIAGERARITASNTDLGLAGGFAAAPFATTFAPLVQAAKDAGGEAGAAFSRTLTKGIADARGVPVGAFEALKGMLEKPLTETAEIARLAGQLTGQTLAAGLRSADPAIREQAAITRNSIIQRFEEIEVRAGIVSANAAAAIAAGLTSADPIIRAAAQSLTDAITGTLPTVETMTALGSAARAAYLASFAAAGGGLGPDGMPLIEPPKSPPKPKPKPLPGVTPAPTSPSFRRGDPGRTQVNVNVSTDHRQNSSAAAITNRYGPTPAEAGSR